MGRLETLERYGSLDRNRRPDFFSNYVGQKNTRKRFDWDDQFHCDSDRLEYQITIRFHFHNQQMDLEKHSHWKVKYYEQYCLYINIIYIIHILFVWLVDVGIKKRIPVSKLRMRA